MSFPGEYRVEWMSPEETYMHLENTGSKIYRGIVEGVGMKKSAGETNNFQALNLNNLIQDIRYFMGTNRSAMLLIDCLM